MASLGSAEAKEPSAGQPASNAIGVDAALSLLMKGNVRYVANRPTHRDFSAGRPASTDGVDAAPIRRWRQSRIRLRRQ